MGLKHEFGNASALVLWNSAQESDIGGRKERHLEKIRREAINEKKGLL